MINPRLEKIFNLAPAEPEPQPVTETPAVTEALEALTESVVAIDKIDAALPRVVGLETTEEELDEIAKMATEGYNNLMELGMSVDTRHAAEIFGAASNLLGHALTAKRNKVEKKLKMIELQLKKFRLDQNTASATEATALTGSAVVMDRNQLLESLKKRQDPSSD